MLLWCILVLLVIIIYVKIFKPLSFWTERNVICDRPWPIVGNLGKIVFRASSFAECIEELYNKYPNSRYIGCLQFMQPALMVRDIELIKQITIKDFDHFVDHRTITSEEIDPLFGKNLITLKGQRWKHMRSTLSPAFTGNKMRSMFVLISECAEQFTDYFLKHADSNKPKTVEMKDIFSRFANDVIATCAFGIKCDSLEERKNEFYEMAKQASTFTGFRAIKVFGYSISPFLMKVFKIKVFDDAVSNFFRNIVFTTVTTREKEGIIRPDMIHLLMQARKGQLKSDSADKDDKDAGFATVEEAEIETDNENIELSNDDMTAQALLFFLAGFDGISTLMCHMAYELALHPDIQKRLQDEIDNSLVASKGKVTYDMITQMKYLDMVVSESLRKWPIGVISDRICNKDYVIEPSKPNEEALIVYKGEMIWIPTFGIHRDPANFPNPLKFDPERFNEENKYKIKPFTYIPFGIGPRNCIGSRFALLEAKVVFTHMLSKFNLVVVEKTQIPLRLSRSNLNLVAENGFWLGLQPRK